MKKAAKWIVVAFAVCAIILAGCKIVLESEPIAVESITLNATALTLAPGDTKKLTATVKPDNADDKSVKWSSSNTAVAMVSSDGTIGAIKTGTTIITAQAGGKTAICVITVNDAAVTNPDSPVVNPDSPVVNPDTPVVNPDTPVVNPDTPVVNPDSPVENPDSPVAVDSITLGTTTLTIEPGKTRELKATVMPNNADDKTVIWSSSDENIATVNNDGTITAHTEGIVTITARAGDKEATCTVTVKRILIAVERVSLKPASLMLTRGETGKLAATVTPDNADDTSVAWSSSNSDVATVDNDGTVTANKAGTATITAQAGDITAECVVTVNPIPVESVTLEITAVTLELGMTRKLTATINPDNADDKTVKWSSSDTSVATVDKDGTVTANKVGTATITAQAGDKQAICMVTVKLQTIAVTSISLNLESIDIPSGDRESLSAKIMPSNADDTTVVWSSSDTTVATISPGLTDNRVDVWGVKAGTATITARAGDKQATCKVTVHDHSYSGGKCTICGRNPYMKNGTIDDTGVLTKYSGKEATVVIPEGVTSIGNSAFKGCSSLTSVTIPNSVTSIVTGAFHNCKSLASVTIPDSVTSIGSFAFEGCTSLTEMTIPDSVTSIGGSAFEGCTNLTNVKISNNLTSIESNMFQMCENLTDITIPDSVTSIGSQAFCGCTSLTSVKIGNGVTSIGRIAFYDCMSLTSVIIGDSVTTIGYDAFNGCTGLTSVTIPKSVTKIGNNAFYDCTNLKNVTYGGTKEKWEIIRDMEDIGLLDENITITYKE